MTDRSWTPCPFCPDDLSALPPRDRAVITPSWRLTAHRSALEGWMLLIPLRHVEALNELTDEEASELGPILRRVSQVHIDEFGAVKTYVMQFAEGVSHAHFSLVPRAPGLSPDRRGARVSAYNSEDTPISETRRDELAHTIQLAWARAGLPGVKAPAHPLRPTS